MAVYNDCHHFTQFNLSHSEYRPVSMLNPDKVDGPIANTLYPVHGVRQADTLHSYSDGSVQGPAGHTQLSTLVVDAFRVSQSTFRGTLSASNSNSLGGAAEDLIVTPPRSALDPTIIFRKIPVKQHFGNPVCMYACVYVVVLLRCCRSSANVLVFLFVDV